MARNRRIEFTPLMLGKVEGIAVCQCPDEEISAFLDIIRIV